MFGPSKDSEYRPGVPLFCAAARSGKRPACPLRIVAPVLASSPGAAVVLVARPPVGEVTAHPPPGSPRSLGTVRYEVVEKKNFFSYTTRKKGQMETAITDFFADIFSCSPIR